MSRLRHASARNRSTIARLDNNRKPERIRRWTS